MAETFNFDTLRGSGTPLLAKMALGMISQDLSSDPKARAAFISDPSGFIKSNYGAVAGANEEAFFQGLAKMYEDGNCCGGGCGCGGGGQGSGCTARLGIQQRE
jgi:hypothetical protein